MGFIRFLLACAVVLCHTSAIMGYMPLSNNLAVQVFYIISGFYMAMVLTEKYNGAGSTYIFYTNRALKIYPVYFVVLILSVAWSVLMYVNHYPGTLDYYTIYAHPSGFTLLYFIVVNIVVIGLETLFLFGIDTSGHLFFTSNFNNTSPNVYNFAFNHIAWTIGIELLFYLVAPWLVRRKWTVLLFVLLLSLGIRIATAKIFFDGQPWNYMFFPSQLMFFVAGIFSYRLYVYLKKIIIPAILYKTGFALFVALVLFYYQVFEESYVKNIVLFVSVTLLIPFAFELTRKNRIDRYLGNLSYPIYISQFLIIRAILSKRVPKILGEGFTALILTILFSILLERVVSQAIEKVRSRRAAQLKHIATQQA